MTKRTLGLIVGDMFLAGFAVILAGYLRLGVLPDPSGVLGAEGGRILVFVAGMLFSSFFAELYGQDKGYVLRELVARLVIAAVISLFVLSSLYYFVPVLMYGRGVLVIAVTILAILQLLWHVCFRLWENFPGFARRVLILGTGPLAQQMGNLVAAGNRNYVLSGYVNCAREPIYVPSETIIGSEEGLCETVRRERPHKIVVSLSERRGVFPIRDVLSCKLSGVEVLDAPSFYERVTGKLLIENITPSWFIFSEGFRVTTLFRILKRMVDIGAALVGLLMVSPFLPLIALIIKLDSPGDILFGQVRVGEGEKEFRIFKFRTMRADAEKGTGAVWAQKDDPRVTRVGRFFRTSRIDEIPQLFNVLKGDMSLVGPRPERPEFVAKLKDIIPYYSERHCVKPGVTGWAQVRYPYGATVDDAIEKLRYDLYYIKNMTLPLDFFIIFETVKVVLFGRGAR